MQKTKRTAVIVGTTAALIGGGIAFAAWTTTGTGSGTATAGTDQALTVTVSPVTGLYPTGTFNVPFTVTNPNSYDVKLSTVTFGTVTVDAGHSGCSASVVSSNTGSGNVLTDTDVVAKNGGVTGSVNFPIAMSNAATDPCKGAVFTVTLTAAGQSN